MQHNFISQAGSRGRWHIYLFRTRVSPYYTSCGISGATQPVRLNEKSRSAADSVFREQERHCGCWTTFHRTFTRQLRNPRAFSFIQPNRGCFPGDSLIDSLLTNSITPGYRLSDYDPVQLPRRSESGPRQRLKRDATKERPWKRGGESRGERSSRAQFVTNRLTALFTISLH